MPDSWDSQLLLVGTNHKHASIEMRERLYCQEDLLPDRLISVIQGCKSIREVVILSTCNRTEIYTVSSHDPTVIEYLTRQMSGWSGIQTAILKRRIYSLKDEEAARHLFAVSSGLDSLVIGERQIQNQVRDAIRVASQAGTASRFMPELFQHTYRVTKNVRKRAIFEIDRTSVSSAAVSFLEQVSGDRQIHSVLLVGAGKMITLAAQHLAKDRNLEIWVANRTIQRAEDLTKRFGGKPLSLNEIPAVLPAVDVVLSCVSSPGYVILGNELDVAMSRRTNKSLILIDIAVPRNIDPASGKIPGIQLFDIDDLAPFLKNDSVSYRTQIAKAKRYVRREAERFFATVKAYTGITTVRELRRTAERIREKELSRALRRLEGISERDKGVVDLLTKSIINKLLHEPTVRLRQQALNGNGYTYETVIRELFAMREEGRR